MPNKVVVHTPPPPPPPAPVPPHRQDCVAPQLVMHQEGDKWERVRVTRDGAVMDVIRPFGHCLVPYRKGKPLRKDQYVLLEDSISKEIVEPYNLISFAVFKQHMARERTFKQNEKIYNVYISCERALMHVKKGECIFVQKKKAVLPFTSVGRFTPASAIELVIPYLYGLDLINFAESCAHMWNLVISREHGKQTIEVSPTVRGYQKLCNFFCIEDPSCDEVYLQEMCDTFISCLQRDQSVTDAASINIKDKTEDITEEPILKKRKHPDSDCNDDAQDNGGAEEESEEEEEERSAGEGGKVEEEARYPWLPEIRQYLGLSEPLPSATTISLPLDFLECHRLHDGAFIGDSQILCSLDDVFELSSAGDVYMQTCDGMGTGYSSLIVVGKEDEEHDLLVMNIDKSDPCYGYVYGYHDYYHSCIRYSFSFSDFIFGLWRMTKANGYQPSFSGNWIRSAVVRTKWLT